MLELRPLGPELVEERLAVPWTELERPHASPDDDPLELWIETERAVETAVIGDRPIEYRWKSASLWMREQPGAPKQAVLDLAESRDEKLDLAGYFRSTARQDWMSMTDLAIAGGAGKLVSLVRVDREEIPPLAPRSAARAILFTIDITTGDRVTLDRVIGAARARSIQRQIAAQLRASAATAASPSEAVRSEAEIERIASSCFAVTRGADRRIEITVGVPNAGDERGASVRLFRFAVASNEPTELVIRRGCFVRCPSVHATVLDLLREHEDVAGAVIASVDELTGGDRDRVGEWLVSRGFEQRPDSGTSRVFDLGWLPADDLGYGQRVILASDGSVALSTFTEWVSEFVASDGAGRVIEHELARSDTLARITPLELSRMPRRGPSAAGETRVLGAG